VESRLKLFGHPIHPMLVVLPLGLLSVGVLFDLVYVFSNDAQWAELAYWNITIGIVGGLAAALFGFIDWLAIPANTRAKSIGLIHGAGNVVIVLLFAISWLIRQNGHAYLPSLLPLVLGLVGVLMALVTAWLGGELVYRLRVGVDPDAGLDASSSLARDGLISVKADPPKQGRAAGTGAP